MRNHRYNYWFLFVAILLAILIFFISQSLLPWGRDVASVVSLAAASIVASFGFMSNIIDLIIKKPDKKPPIVSTFNQSGVGINIGQSNVQKMLVTTGNIYNETIYKNQPSHIQTLDYPEDLPNKGFSKLWGRDDDIVQIMNELRNPNGKTIISISGLGGIGKTAVALETAEICLREGLFEKVIWETSKEEGFIGSDVQQLSPSFSSLDSLITNIAIKLNQERIARERNLKNKLNLLRFILTRNRYLIVIDNLETVSDFKNIVGELSSLATGVSRILLTSRPKLTDFEAIHCVSLKGLEENVFMSFLRHEGKARGIKAIEQAEDKSLHAIFQCIGGAPLAAKLVVTQLSRLPLEIVLSNMRQAKGNMEEVYKFIYRATWNILSSDARKALISMHVFPSSVTRSTIAYVSTVKDDNLIAALNELVSMSLLDTNDQLADSKKRYSMHALTFNFIQTDLVSSWK
ncbi:MAG TPA: NB-ARC domain-containing protein [Anaerolineales bacterium]